MTDLPSPRKVAKGDGPFIASIIFPAQPVEVEEVNRSSIALTTINFDLIDILAPPTNSPNPPKKLYYILDDGFVAKDCDMVRRKKSLVSKIILAGKEAGCRYYTDGWHKWGTKEDQEKEGFCFFKLCCSHSRSKPTSKKGKDGIKEEHIKLASTNNTRLIHGRHHGNRKMARKTCKYRQQCKIQTS
jgi:hypothetical protein